MLRFVTILLALGLCLSGQGPSFDAASVKPAAMDATERSLTHNAGGRLSARNATVRMLVYLAYQVMPYQVSGGPAWVDSDGFDIEAKAAKADTTPEQFRQMVQALLADRFQLKVHKEARELPIYALVVAKGGVKLVAARGDEENPGARNGGREITGVRANMAMLATVLTRPLQHKVVDETGLKGEYNFVVKFEPIGVDAAADQGGSIFMALQEQLGLQLKVSKGEVEVLVIDGAGRPGGN